jgi:hypothetical protein
MGVPVFTLRRDSPITKRAGTDPLIVTVMAVLDERPDGAAAEAITTERGLGSWTEACLSTAQLRLPPETPVTVTVVSPYQPMPSTTRAPDDTACDVVSTTVVELPLP